MRSKKEIEKMIETIEMECPKCVTQCLMNRSVINALTWVLEKNDVIKVNID